MLLQEIHTQGKDDIAILAQGNKNQNLSERLKGMLLLLQCIAGMHSIA
jgi:hypothetical protein